MKRTDWLIAGFLAVLFLFVVGGIMVFWLQSQAYANLPNNSPSLANNQNGAAEGVKAKDAFLAADPLAKQWQPDAQIVSASATIVRFDTLEDIYSGKANWTIVYYSPSTAAVATYTVSPNGVGFLNTKAIETQLPIIEREKVILDSNQVLTIAISNGAAFLFEGIADRVVLLQLEQAQQVGRPVWRIFIQNETSGAFRDFSIDSEEGQIIEQSGS